MDFIAITIANLIWILYSLAEGAKDGLFTHYKNSSKRKCQLDSKVLFNLQKFLVLLSTGGLLIWTLGWISIPFILGQFLMYKYFHKISKDLVTKKLIEEFKEEDTVTKKVKEKSPIMLGITIQIFSYIFLT